MVPLKKKQKKKTTLIATEIKSNETKNSGSIPSHHPGHACARSLK